MLFVELNYHLNHFQSEIFKSETYMQFYTQTHTHIYKYKSTEDVRLEI